MAVKSKANLIRQSGQGAYARWLELFLTLLLFALLSHRMGMLGMAFFAVPYLLYQMIVIGLGDTASGLIRRRAVFFRNRNGYMNAAMFYHGVTLTAFLLTLMISVGLFLGADRLSLLMTGSRLAALGIRLIAVAVLPMVLMRCVGGFLEGMGAVIPGGVASETSLVVSILLAFLVCGRLGAYSEKVAALMRTDHYYYAYMAALGSGSILIGNVIGLLVVLFLKSSLNRRLRQLFDGGYVGKKIKPKECIGAYFGCLFKEIWDRICPYLCILLPMILLLRKTGSLNEKTGEFLLCALLLMEPVRLLAFQITGVMTRGIKKELKYGDLVHVRDRIAISLKVYNYMVFPFLMLLLTLPDVIGQVFFDTEDALFATLLRRGVWCTLALAMFLFAGAVARVVWERWIFSLLLIMDTVITAVIAARMVGGDEPEYTLLFLSFLIGNLVAFVLAAAIVVMELHFHQDLLRSFLLMGVSCVFMGLIAFVIRRVMTEALGAWPVLLLSCVLGTAAYCTCIVMTHTFDAGEWSRVPGKGLPVAIARWLKQY